MAEVVLIVTGQTEERGLPAALERLFPRHAFRATGPAALSGRAAGFTSSRVVIQSSDAQRPNAMSDLDRFAQRLVAEVDPGRSGAPPDFVFAVEDLELDNMDQRDVVESALVAAIQRRVRSVWSNEDRRESCFRRLSERCSFHLLVPMVEAYFFGDKSALDRAGRVPSRVSRFDAATCDVERFRVSDPEYESVSEPSPTDRASSRAAKSDWRRCPVSRRRVHPKKYVQYLCDEHAGGRTLYRESTGGAAALRDLDWNSVLERPDAAASLRAFILDLADALGERVPWTVPGDDASRARRVRTRVLRNLGA